jgi:Na+/H+-dicarboxylate symporter
LTPGRRLAYAGILLAFVAVLAEFIGPTDSQWLRYTLVAFAILLLILAARTLSPETREFLKSLRLPCKTKYEEFVDGCKRCFGHFVGTIVSVVLANLVHHNEDIMRQLGEVPPILHLLVAVALGLPAAWHGRVRRLGKNDPMPHPSARSVTGFLFGLSWFFFYLAISGFFGDR